MKNIGILFSNENDIKYFNELPNNLYICYCIKSLQKEKVINIINFLISMDCINILVIDDSLKQVCKNSKINRNYFIYDKEKVQEFKNNKKFIMYNVKKTTSKNMILSNKVSIIRKDAKPEDTINKIKKILKDNNYIVKEKGIRKNLKGVYSIRLEFKNGNGSNGKGLSLKLAKASAYAELMERLQTNMLNKNRSNTHKIDKNNKLYDALLYKATKKYKNDFFELNNIYFNIDKAIEIKSGSEKSIPINAINAFCHTNGLASGNTFEEAANQGIFEILERYTYQELLNNNIPVKNIDITNYPINAANRKILNRLTKKGFIYYIKDCSMGKYPVLGLLVLDKKRKRYSYTMASDTSFDIALSRAISEMFQGLSFKEFRNKMLLKNDLNDLDRKYKYGYKSYNWLKCFNNNNGYISNNFFCNKYTDIKYLKFKNYLLTNKEVLDFLKTIIEQNIFVKDYNMLGFNTYRVYIPYMSTVDCYDSFDLIINKNYNSLLKTYTNILNSNKQDIELFIIIFLEACKQIKYDELIMPTDLFHLEKISNYYKLDFTSLLFILCLLYKKETEFLNLLNFKIKNFNLSQYKLKLYKIIINKLNNKCIYNIKDKNIETQIELIIESPLVYLKKLKPIQQNNNNLLTKKKSLL